MLENIPSERELQRFDVFRVAVEAHYDKGKSLITPISPEYESYEDAVDCLVRLRVDFPTARIRGEKILA